MFFGGSWNPTHVISEHLSGEGKCNHYHQPTPDATNNNQHQEAIASLAQVRTNN
jgi:hypothetical protein